MYVYVCTFHVLVEWWHRHQDVPFPCARPRAEPQSWRLKAGDRQYHVNMPMHLNRFWDFWGSNIGNVETVLKTLGNWILEIRSFSPSR